MSRPLPRISIVTPSYQQAGYIEATLRSVLDQGYPELEYLVIDGGSRDGTVDILKRYEPRFAYWESARDRGQYDAVERGLRRATGEVMGWLNSDDLYFPWTLRAVAGIFAQHPEVEWICSLEAGHLDKVGMCAAWNPVNGYSREAFLDGRFLGHRPSVPTVSPRGWIQQESMFWRRGLWERSGARLGAQKLAADFDLWARFYEHAELVGVATPLALFRFHPDQRSARMDEYVGEAAQALARMRAAQGWRPPRARQAAYRARLDKVPALAAAVAKGVGYRGKRIVRRVGPDGVGSWVMEGYAFL